MTPISAEHGNGIGDISYTEKLAGHTRMMVSWGTPDRRLSSDTFMRRY